MIAVLRTSKPANFAELHERLGGVPLERICTDPAPGTATENDVVRFLESPARRLYELIDGTLVEKAMGTAESMLASYIGGLFWAYLTENDIGIVLGGDGAVRMMAGNVRYPDVSFLPWELVPNDPLREKIWHVTPPLAIEVLSESNTPFEIEQKIQEFFASGCRMMWIIDPRVQSARVYTAVESSSDVGPAGALDGGDILPGFRLPLSRLFNLIEVRGNEQ